VKRPNCASYKAFVVILAAACCADQTHAQNAAFDPLSRLEAGASDKGVRLALIYDGEVAGNLAGGAKRGAT